MVTYIMRDSIRDSPRRNSVQKTPISSLASDSQKSQSANSSMLATAVVSRHKHSRYFHL
jgi:hypothetical protein